ncbi:MAG: o-succinylbenzoate synthase [Cyanobacteria bacterium QS_8_64_29]|nr:MAG: o-succinylbenzoate synthase [Cyanobacteria bacterium QS_8_64_29]
MAYRLHVRPYRHPLQQPLATARGSWSVREGIWVQLSDGAERVGWGEIAPLPRFGSETQAQALVFCRQAEPAITEAAITAIPDALPACQFGFESALTALQSPERGLPALRYSYLLPSGAAALQAWPAAWASGARTFKVKIGTQPLPVELAQFERLSQALPATARLRLDANGSLTPETARQWLAAADRAGIVEFLEQPLPPERWPDLQALQGEFATAVALDESAATLARLAACHRAGWRGPMAVKVAVAGSPARLRRFCRAHAIDAVPSSALETATGRQAALRVAAQIASADRAVGFGVEPWLSEAARS